MNLFHHDFRMLSGYLSAGLSSRYQPPNLQGSRQKKYLTYVAACLLFSLFQFAGCRTYDAAGFRSRPRFPAQRGTPTHNFSGSCVDKYDSSIDYFPDKSGITEAKTFSVEYFKHYKVVRLHVAALIDEEQNVADTMVLVQCGTPVPALHGNLAGAEIITIPAATAAVNDNGDMKDLNELGMSDRLVAIGGRETYDAAIRERWKRKELASIGYAWNGPPEMEVLLALHPGVLFMRRATLEQGDALERARSLGIAAVPTVARTEPTLLGSAEWIKFFGIFFNREQRANEVFDGVTTRYQQLRGLAQAAPNKPQAVWLSYDTGGSWKTARSPLDYRTTLLREAGAENPLESKEALLGGRVSTEELWHRASATQVWISENESTRGWPGSGLMNRFPAYAEKRVYHHEARSDLTIPAYDWYESGVVHPEFVLEDLVSLFHPELVPNHRLTYFAPIRRASQ